MIEAFAHGLQRDLLPAVRVMAGLATLRKTSVMRVFVAIRTLIKRDAHILRFPVRSIDVALCTLHLRMQSGQRIPSLAMIELRDIDRLPIVEVVATLAGLAKTPLMRVLVAGRACSREPQVRMVEVLILNRRAILRRNVSCVVAFIATHTCVLAFENVPSVLVIEGLGVPLDQRKILTVMLGVAARAFLARSGRNVVRRM